MEDGATPYAEIVKKQMSMVTRGAVREATFVIRQSIIESFDKRMYFDPPRNTLATMEAKALNRFLGGALVLVETGSLKDAINNPDIEIYNRGQGRISGTIKYKLPEAGTECYLPGQKRANPDYIYLWAHELGTKGWSYKFGAKHKGKYATFKLPKRDFLKRGMKKGLTRAYAIFGARLKAFFKELDQLHKQYQFHMPSSEMENEFKISTWDLGMAVMPPSRLYAYMGASADFLSYLRGSFTLPNIERWMTSWSKGRGGVTKKVQRRKFRRAIWR